MSQQKGQLEKLMFEIADLRNENHHLKKLLSETKLSIKNARGAIESQMNGTACLILDKTIAALVANKIKDLFVLNFDL